MIRDNSKPSESQRSSAGTPPLKTDTPPRLANQKNNSGTTLNKDIRESDIDDQAKN